MELPSLDDLRTSFDLGDWSDTDIIGEFSRVTGMDQYRAAEAFGVKVNEPGFFTSLKSGLASYPKGAGELVGLLPGMDENNFLTRYAEDVQFRNPTDVVDLESLGAGLVERPWETLKQVTGQAIGSTLPSLVAAPLKGVSAAAEAPAMIRAGVGLLRGLGSTAGQTAIAALPSFGEIRETQRDTGIADEGWSELAALVGSGAVGLIETKFGIQPRVAKMLAGATTPEAKRIALQAAADELYGKTPIRTFFKEGAKTVAEESLLEEGTQTPIEQFAGGLNPTDPEQLKNTAFSVSAAALGTLPFGGLAGAYQAGQHSQYNTLFPEGAAALIQPPAPAPDLSTPEGRQAAIAATPSTEEAFTRARETVQGELERLGLKDVGVQVLDRIFTETGDQADAAYVSGQKLVQLALDTPEEQWVGVVNHEVVHAMKEMGLFRDKEWGILSKAAENYASRNPTRAWQYIEQFTNGKGLKNVPEENRARLMEEMIADMNRDYREGKLRPMKGLAGLLDRMNKFMEALRNGFHGLGFESSVGVLERLQRGEIGGRGRAVGEVAAPGQQLFSLRVRPTLPLSDQPQPEFYSAVQEVIGSAPKDSYTGAEWLQMLTPKTGKATAHPANVAGVRLEELEWNGLRSLLTSLQGDQIAKKDLLDEVFLSQPRVTFQGGWADDSNSGIAWGDWQDAMTEENSRWRTPELTRVGIRQASSDYTGGLEGGFAVGHFRDVPNNIGWYRFGELVTPEGQRILFIDEVQSDWQQRYRSSITKEILEENRKQDPTTRKELPQPMVDLRPESYTAQPDGEKAVGSKVFIQLLKSNLKVEKELLQEWVQNNNYKSESPMTVSKAWLKHVMLGRIVSAIDWSSTDPEAASLSRNKLAVDDGIASAKGLWEALSRDAMAKEEDKPSAAIPYNTLGYKYILGTEYAYLQERQFAAVERAVRGIVNAHMKTAFTPVRGWSIVRKDGTVVARNYVPSDIGQGIRPGSVENVVRSWLDEEKAQMSPGWDIDTPKRGPAGPWVGKRDSFARLMLLDALHLAAKNGMDGVVIIPGLDQAIRNGKTIEDPVVGIYDKNLQEDLRKAVKELGGAPELEVEYRRGKQTFERDIAMEAATWGSSRRPMTHQQRQNVLTIAEQLVAQQSTGERVTPAIVVAAQDSVALIRDRINQDIASVYHYLSDPRDGVSKMIIESDIDSALMPLGNQIVEEDRTLVHRLVLSAIRRASDSVWNAGEQGRQAISGLEAAARPIDTEIVLRGLIDQLDAIAMNRAVRIRPDIASLGLTSQTAGILHNALLGIRRYTQRQSRADAVIFTQEVLTHFRRELASVLASANVRSPEVADSLLRKGEVVLLYAMKEAGASSRRMDQPRIAKGVQMTPAVANKLGENGARYFSIRRNTQQHITTDSSVATRTISSLNRIFGTSLPAEKLGKQRARFNSFMKHMLTLPQVERENWSVPGVSQFTDAARQWWGTKGRWVAQWDNWVDGVRRSGYGKEGLSKLWRFANEVTLRSDELGRRLSIDELADEARKVGGLDTGLMNLWANGRQLLDKALVELEGVVQARIEQTWNDRLGQEKDIVARIEMERARDEALKESRDDFQKMRNRDYWPLSRFGEFVVHMKANTPGFKHMGKEFKKDQTVLFEAYETEKEQLARKVELLRTHGDAVRVAAGKVDESVYSFQGLPPSVLRMMENELMEASREFLVGDETVDAETMQLVNAQLNALRTAMLHFTPENAFKQRMLRRKGTRGFTDDGLRAMASLGQSFAGHIARARHRGEMDNALKVLDGHRRAMEFSPDPAMATEGNKLTDLLNFLRRSQRDMMNPGDDLANLRAAGFLWYLGFVPRAAVVQVMQPIFTTYPWLASRYGDGSAVAEMAKGYGLLRRMFKNKAGDLPDFLERAITAGIDDGFLNQSLFTELAGLAEGSNLQRLMPGKFLKSKEAAGAIRKAGHYASWMFQKGEEVNRLVTFRAAFMLELREALGMKGASEGQLVERMAAVKGTEEGTTAFDLAYRAGRTAVETTQGEYARWARPQLMRGKKSAVFLFKMYSQIMTYFAFRDPGAMRFWALQLAIAGALGLPFAEDALEILNAATQGRLCDKGDIKLCVREYLDEMGVNPELAMHGLSRIATPWDFSASMSLGRIIPGVEPAMSALMPGGNLQDQALRFQSEALGALFSIPLNWFKAASSGEERDIEAAMPTAVRDVYRTYRRMREGGERDRSGAMIADIDWSDPMDVTTHLGQAIGLRPAEVAAEQEMRWAQKEASRYWKGRREAVVGQYYHIFKSGQQADREALADVMKAITEFNQSVPFPEMGISGKQLRQGLKQTLQRQRLSEGGQAPEKKYRRLYSEVAEGFAPAN
jgi:hypothetical protein